MKVVELAAEGKRKLNKNKSYYGLETPAGMQADNATVQDWMDYRGTPGGTVYRVDQGNRGVLWMVEV